MAYDSKYRGSASGESGLKASLVKDRIDQLHAKFSRSPPQGSNYRSLMSAENDSQHKSSGTTALDEMAALKAECQQLKRELRHANNTVAELTEREHLLRDRLSDQAKKQLEKSGKFEDINLGDNRPTQLIRRYGNLYSQSRVDALDALDGLDEITEFDDLKGKLLFSIIVLSFRSIGNRLHDVKMQLHQLLRGGASIGSLDDDLDSKSVHHSVLLYLRKNVSKYDLSLNVEEVEELVWTTLFDFPCLQQCVALKAYIKECVHLAWALSVQNPPLTIHSDLGPYREELYDRFHSSDPDRDEVKLVVWPALIEEESGHCLWKGVAVT